MSVSDDALNRLAAKLVPRLNRIADKAMEVPDDEDTVLMRRQVTVWKQVRVCRFCLTEWNTHSQRVCEARRLTESG